MAYETHQQLVG